MKLLIISDRIHSWDLKGENGFQKPEHVDLTIDDLNSEEFHSSLFDFDVSIIHIREPQYGTSGYFRNLPKLEADFSMALNHGRCVICLAGSNNFNSRNSRETGLKVFHWLENAGIVLSDNRGTSISPSGLGQAKVIRDYLEIAPEYHQIVLEPLVSSDEKLAVVTGTDITIGMERSIANGTVVILPPPADIVRHLGALIELACRYYGKVQRRIITGDVPDWLTKYTLKRSREITLEIEKLEQEKAVYDSIAYTLYGTGVDLENSVKLLFENIGFSVEKQPKGSNIDLIIGHPKLDFQFSVEITGTRDTVKKDSNKMVQAWKHIAEREGSSCEHDRMIILANTQCHLEPVLRDAPPFSPEVINLTSKHGLLLLTTTQLYSLWTCIREGKITSEQLAQELAYSPPGPFAEKPRVWK